MSFQQEARGRRGFLQRALAFAGLSAAAQVPAAAQNSSRRAVTLPDYTRVQTYQSLKQSSHDTTGGNHDYWGIDVGQTKEIFASSESGAITHIWFTISSPTPV